MNLNLILHRLVLVMVFLLWSSTNVFANQAFSNGFFFETKKKSFINKTGRVKCAGKVPYPYITNSDQELSNSLNMYIENFIETYALCNMGKHNHYKVWFEIPESGHTKFFSVLWRTNKYGSLYRVDTMNFNANNATLIDLNSIFHIHSNNLMHEIAKISEGHLDFDITWEEFIDKINSRDVQLYLKQGEWFVVFNANLKNDNVVEVKLPKYFLQTQMKNDR